ncbi:AAEL012210-PA [Aedes aegypti]|uniref:AAEL012210-PA n=1 Tax=Aedes aegypti TaxID=7159 RepID=Q16MR8_AEDAE|nr:AAEL012210-PA [Aedes aegypti]
MDIYSSVIGARTTRRASFRGLSEKNHQKAPFEGAFVFPLFPQFRRLARLDCRPFILSALVTVPCTGAALYKCVQRIL